MGFEQLVHQDTQSLPNAHDLFSCCSCTNKNSEPYVGVSTVACFFENQSTCVLLIKWRHQAQDLPVAEQWFKLASMVAVVTTAS